MSGGLQQIVAFGAQDVYITGNPQITFFKALYKRHTNFSTEPIEQVHNGNAGFGQTIQCNIARQGDLINKMYLQITMNQLTVNGSNFEQNNTNIAWVRRLGFSIIDYVELEIGGSKIDKQYGSWLDVWYELTHCYNQEKGYRKMIGDTEEVTALQRPDENTGLVKDEFTMFVPLQFFFCRHDGQSLPLIALQYHDVKVTVKFNSAAKQVVWTGVNTLANARISIKEVKLWVDYVFLDSQERHRFARIPHEYLIEHVQFLGAESVNGAGLKNQLRFNHPTKEIIWALKVGAFNGEGVTSGSNSKGKFLCYSSDDSRWDTALEYAAVSVANSMIQVELVDLADDAAVTAYKTANFPTSNTAAAPNTLHNDNLVFNYENGGRIIQHNSGLDLQLYHLFQDQDGNVVTDGAAAAGGGAGGGTITDHQLPVITINPVPLIRDGYNIAQHIKVVDLVVELTVTGDNANDNFTAIQKLTDQLSVIRHELTLEDVSIPIDQWTDNRDVADDKKFDVTVVQHHNYGLRLDGQGNPVQNAKLSFNANDRFRVREGEYFNNVQSFQHHKRTPADGVNLYSFALQPEKYQPTGTANLSRIDTVVLDINFNDSLRSGKQVPSLNIYDNSRFYVFAFSYNVLRIMSGMGGLAYAN